MSTEMQTKVQASPAQSFTPVQTGLLQRKSALCNTRGLVEDSGRDKEKLTLQRSSVDQAGTTSVPRFGHDFSRVSVHSTGPGMIQTKLKINEPGDPYEQEADRVADAVMRMPEPGVQRKVEPEEEEGEEEFLQTRKLPGQSPEVMPALSSSIQSLKGGGQALPESVRAYFEPRFGYDFSQVRVHTGTQAAEVARAVNAKAFTIRRDVVFGEEQYMPGTSTGRRLLAHELAHVVQQAENNTIISCQLSGERKIFLRDLVTSDTDMTSVVNKRIKETEEYKSFMEPRNIWQWKGKVTEQEAIFACRLIIQDLAAGNRVNWDEEARKYVNIARTVLRAIEPGLKTETQIAETVPKEKEKTIPEPKPTVEEDCFSGTEDSCGEYDDATGIIIIEGRKVGKKLSKRLSIPDGLKGILSRNWEIRFMQKGRCCSYISFRAKSGKKEGVIWGKFKWEVTPLRGDFKYRKNICTGKSRCSGQISSEGTLTIFPYESLKKIFEEKGWKGLVIPRITLNLVVGSNIYAAPPESENIVRLIFFATLRGDSRWDFELGSIRLRYGLKCPFAESELGRKPVWNFTTDKCWENLKNDLPLNLKLEIKAPSLPVVPEIPLPIPKRFPSLRLPTERYRL